MHQLSHSPATLSSCDAPCHAVPLWRVLGACWKSPSPKSALTEHEPPTQVRRAALATQRIEAFKGQSLQARAVVFEQRLAQRDLKPVMDLLPVPQAYGSSKHPLGDSIDSLLAKDLTCESEAIDLADGAPIREISKKIGSASSATFHPTRRSPSAVPRSRPR